MAEPQTQAGSRGGSNAGAAEAAAEAAPQLLPYQLDADGRKQPLAGVQSIFLRGNTAAAMGLGDLSNRGPTPQLMAPVPKEKLLADVQFQGAISDFHPIREFIKAADYDPLLIRVNDDDLYGDGNNYEVACSKAAADVWVAIEEAAAAAAQQAAAAVDEAAAGPGPKPRQLRPPRPWEDQGTEAELAATLDRPRRDAVVVLASRPRREFGGPCSLGDVSATELWQSNTMECRPFKDAAYDLKRHQQDGAVQAVAAVAESGVQATGARPVPGSTQYVPQSLSPAEQEALLSAPGVVRTIELAGYRCEEALLQNNVTNIFADDLATLADEEVQGAGGRQDGGGLAEAQSFTDLLYSKNKVVSAVRWVPGRRGVIAVACTDPASYNDRLAKLGRPSNAFILVWNVRDPIHPEYVLESPHEVFCFDYNPANPSIVAAGCYNGQLVVWDTTNDLARLGGRHGGGRGARDLDDGGGDEATTPVIRHQYMSAVEFSHTTLVADLTWLPGIEIDRQGKVYNIRAGSAGTSAQALVRSQTLGAAAMAAAAAGSHVPRACCFMATCAGDGKVLFWDVRVDKLVKKGTKKMDVDDLVWRPMHVVHLLSSQGMDFAGARLCFDLQKLELGEFLAGSGDGEILLGTFIRPAGSDNPDYCQLCHQPHAGPIVALARSPFFEDLVLSVGDWSFRLWRGADSTQPLYTSPYAPECYTAGCWSPTRPGVLFLANAAGTLAVWDLLDRSHEPCLAYAAAPCAVMSLCFAGNVPHTGGGGLLEGGGEGAAAGSNQPPAATNPAAYSASAQLLALGDAAGVLHLLELPRTLRRPMANERKHMAAWLGREAERVGDAARRKASRKAGTKPGTDAPDAAAAGAADSAKDAAATGGSGKDTGLLSTGTTAAVGTGTLRGTLGATMGGLGGTLRGTLGAGGAGSDAVRQMQEDQALEKAEKVYKAMEAEFKAALGLIPASAR